MFGNKIGNKFKENIHLIKFDQPLLYFTSTIKGIFSHGNKHKFFFFHSIQFL